MALSEDTPLAKVIPAGHAKKFRDSRDLRTVGDLLAYWPRRYRTGEADLGHLEVGSYLVAVAEVKSAVTIPMRQRRGSRLQVVVTDGHHDLSMTWFRPYPHDRLLRPGVRAVFAGQVSEFRHEKQLAHPGYTVLEDDADERHLIPIYKQVGNLHTWTVSETVRVVLELLDEVEDPIPELVRTRRRLVSRAKALRGVHRPDTMDEVYAARHRLSYEEAFVLQAALAQRRAQLALIATAARTPREGGLLSDFDARLPFALTAGQQEVGATIAEELAREVPMHRLLQGEVGSGKTVVALRAMLSVVDAGGQAALLAPTEVLAAQHHRTITAMLGDLAEGGLLGGSANGTRVALLTGSMTAAARKRALLDIASGAAGIVIGTHALIQEHVQFADLALIVVDEQHRFGVEQRDALRSKGAHPPHVLVMTATPIPRTVAMTVFGDMETSTLRELPAGRQEIMSHVVPQWRDGWLPRTWEKVAEVVREGRQAYVVCPRIVDTDGEAGAGRTGGTDDGVEGLELIDPEAADALFDLPDAPPRPVESVEKVHAELLADPAFAGMRIEVLHGQLDADTKDAVMRAFADGDIDVLVSTTVIEVGVDVPNATVMVVMDADRFGVSQLHQLRGRVGRGDHPGLALFVTGAQDAAVGDRLEAVAATTDGFELSRLDLSTRREGDILGAAQHGRSSHLEFLRILEHEDLIDAAREDAFAIVDADPDLEHHPALAAAVEARLDEERAAYLERG